MNWETTIKPELCLNGRFLSLRDVPPQMPLLDFLRSRGLTGAKEGCAEGECGACTVLLVRDTANGTAYRAMNSCLMFAGMAAGQEVWTVESLADKGKLCEVQAAMAADGGSQCGYCTPGFVVSLFAEQYRPGRTGPCDPHAMGGNLCRCTGYRPIRDAALSLGPAPAGAFLDRLAKPAPPMESLDYAAAGVQFSRPATVEECCALLAQDPDATIVAGGTDVGVESNLRARRWKHLVSLEAIEELQRFAETSDSVIIGAGLPLTEIEARWTGPPTAFRDWFPLFASPTLRNRATLGGNLATASPIGDSAPLLLAFEALVHIAGPAGRRIEPLATFFHGYRKTSLRPGEVLTAVEIPKPFPHPSVFYKVAKRRMDDISTVAAAITLALDAGGRISRARFAYGGVAAVPLRVTAAEDAVIGRAWDKRTLRIAQEAVENALHPMSDHRGSAEYRLAMSASLIEKFYYESSEIAA